MVDPQPPVYLAITDDQIGQCFPVMHQLRPHLDPASFIDRIRAQQAEGYQLAALVNETSVVAVAGFRVNLMLATGRTLYVDDLIVDAGERSQGYGAALLQWLIAHARELGCNAFSLDCGTQRRDSHAFYFRNNLRISSFHFFLAL